MVQPLKSFQESSPGALSEVELRLDELVALPLQSNRVSEAVRHSLLGGGKRLRPSMLILVTESLAGDRTVALDPACAVEMVHAASLILDDLPCMDDSAMRRSRPSCHSRYGVGTATLAAIALLNRAYHVLSGAPGVTAATRSELVRTLAHAISDCSGMVAGQMNDLAATSGQVDLEDVHTLVGQKTAGLFACAADMGARLADADAESRCGMREFARKFGMCFQILDDLADVESSQDDLGKEVRKDSGKATFASLLGPVAARRAAQGFAEESMAALASIGRGSSVVAELALDTFESAGLSVAEVGTC